jgi:tetratricopeptide (TPR) repeat protein
MIEGPHALADRLQAEERDVLEDTADGRLRRAVQLHLDGHLDLARQVYEDLLTERPDHPTARSNLGLLLLQVGDVSGARAHLEPRVSLDELSPTALANLAHARIRSGEVASGIAVLEQAVARAPESATWLLLAQARLLAGDLAGALAALRVAVQRLPERADAWRLLGTCLAAAGAYEDALAAFDRAVALDPRDAAAWRQLGVLLLARDDAGSAAAALRRAVVLDQASLDARRQLAAALCALDDIDGAVAHLDEAVRRGDADAAVDRAVLALADGTAELALDLLRGVPDQHTAAPRARLYLGYALLTLQHETAARETFLGLAAGTGVIAEQAGAVLAQMDA